MARITESDVYNLLGYTNWKPFSKIKKELTLILEEAKIPFLKDRGINIPEKAIIFHLDALRGKGYAKSRISQHQKRSPTKRGHQESEYKLTDEGLRMSMRYSQIFFTSPEGNFELE